MVKLPSVTCLKVENLFFNSKIEWWNCNFYIGNYCISFASYGKPKILKLPILSNEWCLDSNLLPKWKKICIRFKYQYCHLLLICTIKQVPVNTHSSLLSTIARVICLWQPHPFLVPWTLPTMVMLSRAKGVHITYQHILLVLENSFPH
jgi:hypothetical protein